MTFDGDEPRDQLIDVGRAVVAARLVVGSGGNLSVRCPACARTGETPDGAGFWVTAAGTWLDALDRSDFVRVDLSSRLPVDGQAGSSRAGSAPEARAGSAAEARPRRAPSSEYLLHLATYRVRPDVNAIIHLHPQVAVLLDALDEPIRLATTDHAFYLRRVGRVPFHLPGTAELAEAAAAASSDGTNCLILARHGCSVLGPTVEMAYKRALYLEEAARLTYRVLLLGRPADRLALPGDIFASGRYADPTTTAI